MEEAGCWQRRSPSRAPANRPRPPHVEVPIIDPRPEDVATLDGILKAFYETVTGPPGQQRDWGRDHTLYIPNARFVTTGVRGGKPFATVFEYQTYADSANQWMVKIGFYEKEIHRVVQRFGSLAHVMSTFESRLKPDGPVTAIISPLPMLRSMSRTSVTGTSPVSDFVTPRISIRGGPGRPITTRLG